MHTHLDDGVEAVRSDCCFRVNSMVTCIEKMLLTRTIPCPQP